MRCRAMPCLTAQTSKSACQGGNIVPTWRTHGERPRQHRRDRRRTVRKTFARSCSETRADVATCGQLARLEYTYSTVKSCCGEAPAPPCLSLQGEAAGGSARVGEGRIPNNPIPSQASRAKGEADLELKVTLNVKRRKCCCNSTNNSRQAVAGLTDPGQNCLFSC